MKYRVLIFSLLTIVITYSKATDSTIDSLKSILKTNNLALRSLALNKLTENYLYSNNDSAVKYGSLSIEAATKAGLKSNEAFAFNNTGVAYMEKGVYTNALDNFIKAEKIFESLNDYNGKAIATLNVGRIYELQNLFDKSLSYYTLGLTYSEKTGNNKIKSTAFNHIGSLYYSTNDKTKALEYFVKYLNTAKELDNIAMIMEGLNNVAVIYQELGQYEEALNNFNQYLNHSKKNNDKHSQVIAYHNIALVYQDQKNIFKTILYLDSSVAVANEIKDYEDLIEIYTTYTEVFTHDHNYEKALEAFQYKAAAKDSLLQQTRDKQFIEMSTKYESDKKEAENKVLKANSETQKAISIAVTIGLILVAALAFLILRGYNAKKKANNLLALQNNEIKQQKGIIETKQKEILDSITYAKQLQEAILPPLSHIKKFLPDSFIYYKPKDIVAGDFYWMEHKNNITFIAAADCTGHGVPGAMVSVVCSNALNRAVLEFNITDPGLILDKTRELVLETFAKSDADVKDGMDISLCTIDTNNNIIKWAGANNPLWYTNNHQIIEVTANKQPIGKSDNPVPFSSHTIQLNKGDSLFLFTDGFPDQFGGPKGKKFKYKQFQELLLSNISLDNQQFANKIDSVFTKWKGNLEQVDDVCVIGIRL